MQQLSRLMHALAVTATALFTHTAFAQATGLPPAIDPASVTRLAWRCSFEIDESYNMACVPFAFAADGSETLPVPAPMPVAAMPGRPNYRPVSTRPLDEIFAVEVWRVPLFGPVTDMERVRELLSAVLCGRHPDCAVHTEDLGLHAHAAPPRRR